VNIKTCLIISRSFCSVHLVNKIMIMNSTLSSHHIRSIDNPTAINELVPINYDSTGAILFIIVVLLWYSLGIVCMLGMQIKARDETIEDCARRRAKFLIETLRDQTHTKQILGIIYSFNHKIISLVFCRRTCR
jgi:hypothetical protein